MASKTSASARESSVASISRQSDAVSSLPESENDEHNFSVFEQLYYSVQWLFESIFRRTQDGSADETKSIHLPSKYNRVSGMLKYFTFGVMFTNGIFSFILFLIGLWSLFENRQIKYIPNTRPDERPSFNPFSAIAIVLCTLGLVSFLLSLISCLGINRENLFLLRISLISQTILLVSFIIFAGSIWVWSNRISRKTADAMKIGLRSFYHFDEAWTKFFDKLHLNYLCCGVYSFDDWNENSNYACNEQNLIRTSDACSIPLSCCQNQNIDNISSTSWNKLPYKCVENILPLPNQTMNIDQIHKKVHMNGCFDEILPIIQQLIFSAALFMTLMSLIVVITMVLTFILTFQIRLTSKNVQRRINRKRMIVEKNNDDQF